MESRLHGFLKKLGVAFLLNQGCFLVDTEVALTRFGQRQLHELDGRHVIDVCGVGDMFLPTSRRRRKPESEDPRYLFKHIILRGIEVKVSRSDFRNGFVCSGCNYNYLLTPMRLVSPSELPRGVGLIEYNKYKFSVELTEEDVFNFKGLRVVKKPSFRRMMQCQIDSATAYISRRKAGERTKGLLDELVKGHSDFGYSHP